MRRSLNYPFKHRIRIDVTQHWCSLPVSREHVLPFPHILPVAMMSEAERTGLTSAMGTPSGGRQCSTIMPLIGTSFPWGSCSKFLRRSVWKDKRQLSLRAESKPIFGLSMPIAFITPYPALSTPPALRFGNLGKAGQESRRVQTFSTVLRPSARVAGVMGSVHLDSSVSSPLCLYSNGFFFSLCTANLFNLKTERNTKCPKMVRFQVG